VLDFSNPRDLRNYLIGFFPKLNHEWRIYDVTGNEEKYDAKAMFWQYTVGYNIIVWLIYGTYLINVSIFPEWLNVWTLTVDVRIIEYWELTVLTVFAIAFAIACLLAVQRTDIELPNNEQRLLRVPKGKRKSRVTVGLIYIVAWIFFITPLFFAIMTVNYANVIMLGALPIYMWIFTKFTDGIDIVTPTYQIIDKE